MLLDLSTASLLFIFSVGMCTSYHFEERRGFVLNPFERLIRCSLGFAKLPYRASIRSSGDCQGSSSRRSESQQVFDSVPITYRAKSLRKSPIAE